MRSSVHRDQDRRRRSDDLGREGFGLDGESTLTLMAFEDELRWYGPWQSKDTHRAVQKWETKTECLVTRADSQLGVMTAGQTSLNLDARMGGWANICLGSTPSCKRWVTKIKKSLNLADPHAATEFACAMVYRNAPVQWEIITICIEIFQNLLPMYIKFIPGTILDALHPGVQFQYDSIFLHLPQTLHKHQHRTSGQLVYRLS